MNDPLLVDECLSHDLVALAHSRGHHATHVGFRGLNGSSDLGLMPTIRAEGFVLVTSNARDFVRLYQREDVHSGLIVIVPGRVRTSEQVRLFGLVLDKIEPMTDLINKLVVIDAAGVVQLTDLPGA